VDTFVFPLGLRAATIFPGKFYLIPSLAVCNYRDEAVEQWGGWSG